MSNNVLLFFPEYQDVHFQKDVGQIPMFLSDLIGGEFHLVMNYDSGINENQKIIAHSSNISLFLAYFCALFEVKPKISIFFFFDYRSLFLGLFSRLFTGSKVYIKGDLNLQNFQNKTKTSKIFFFKKRLLFKVFDLLGFIYSVETITGFEYLKNVYNLKKIRYIPNGTNYPSELSLDGNRENIILTVGRLGTYSKNTQQFLEIAKDFLLHDSTGVWKFQLVGPIEDETDFIEFKNNFFQENPNLVSKIEFLGSIEDRGLLLQIYKKSKLFLLPSRFESFGIVLSEASVNGLIISASTHVASFSDITDNGRLGFQFDLQEANIGEKLYNFVTTSDLEKLSREQAAFAQERFLWSKIVANLYTHLK